MEVLIPTLGPIFQNAGLTGALLFVGLVGVVWIVRTSSSLTKQTNKDGTPDANSISKSLGSIQNRLGEVEKELGDRVTREEFHKVEVQVSRIDERIKALNETAGKTASSVERIEDFLINYGKRK